MRAVASGPAGEKAESAGQDQTGWPEGTFLVDQLGRVARAFGMRRAGHAGQREQRRTDG